MILFVYGDDVVPFGTSIGNRWHEMFIGSIAIRLQDFLSFLGTLSSTQQPPSKPVEQPPGRVDGHSFEEERRRRQEEDLRLLEQRFEQMKSQVVSDGTQAQFLPQAISPVVNRTPSFDLCAPQFNS